MPENKSSTPTTQRDPNLLAPDVPSFLAPFVVSPPAARVRESAKSRTWSRMMHASARDTLCTHAMQIRLRTRYIPETPADSVSDDRGASPEKYSTSPSLVTSLDGHLSRIQAFSSADRGGLQPVERKASRSFAATPDDSAAPSPCEDGVLMCARTQPFPQYQHSVRTSVRLLRRRTRGPPRRRECQSSKGVQFCCLARARLQGVPHSAQ